MRKKILLIVAVVLGLFSVEPLARAVCKCGTLNNLDQEFKNASLVFLGTAVNIAKQPDGQDYRFVYFSVDRAWKGVTGLKARVKVGVEPACGFGFQLNKRYLVFSSDTSPDYTSGCRRTQIAESATKDIEALGKSVPRSEPVNVLCQTSKGEMELVVEPEWSPLGAKRFLELVDGGFYKDIPLFRCVPNFLCQFGATTPKKNAKSYSPIKDDPKNRSLGTFKKGYLSFAGSGPDSRSTHVFISLSNSDSLGKMPWETPFAHVTPKSFEKTVSKFNTSYGDMAPWGKGPDPQKIGASGGADYLKKNFKDLDYIKSCSRK